MDDCKEENVSRICISFDRSTKLRGAHRCPSTDRESYECFPIYSFKIVVHLHTSLDRITVQFFEYLFDCDRRQEATTQACSQACTQAMTQAWVLLGLFLDPISAHDLLDTFYYVDVLTICILLFITVSACISYRKEYPDRLA